MADREQVGEVGEEHKSCRLDFIQNVIEVIEDSFFFLVLRQYQT